MAILNNYQDCLMSKMGDVSNVVSKLLRDKYPEVKKEVCTLIIELCKKMPHQIGINGLSISTSLVLNLKH